MILTPLDALLLYLVWRKGQSGYDIRQLFRSTPLGIFSDSPGAIYPALARLETRGLLSSIAEADGRRRRVYQRTAAAEQALSDWLQAPIDPDAADRRPQDLDLRYVLLANVLGPPEARKFLLRCAEFQHTRLAAVEAYRAERGAAMDAPSLAATELGMRLMRTRLQWCLEMSSVAEDEDNAEVKSRRPRR